MTKTPSYSGYRVPPDIITHAVWLYHRFTLSFRDIEDLLAERGISVSYETIRQWCQTFGPQYARRIKKRQGPRGDRWFLDEVVVNIQGKRRYLWRAVDQDGELIDILVQKRKATRAAKRFLSKITAFSNRSADRDNHGQISQLRRCQARCDAFSPALPRSIRQQPS
jgi:putative transposase